MTACPVCRGNRVVDTVRRERLPVMQNYVYRTRASAMSAPQGAFTLAVCRDCDFAWNRSFDPALLTYDEGYDNAVPSAVMDAYYREIVEFLRAHYALEDGLVVDVGCGNGAFLKLVCESVPGCRGLGVDPALKEDRSDLDGRIVLRKDVFKPEHVAEPPSLVASRHVLEHIPHPVGFLGGIRSAVARRGGSPCFFEVPDLGWIVEHESFWDFCYEHCNYFTQASFAAALREAGLAPSWAREAFGAQYLWLAAGADPTAQSSDHGPATPGGLSDRLAAYAADEDASIRAATERLRAWKDDGVTVAVWGMATKGVLFSLLVDPDATTIDFCVDINENKQGCFVPLTGHRIDAPEALRAARDQSLVVLVMNENYSAEIERSCRDMGLEPTLVTTTQLQKTPR
jgi:hypothetical protein